MRLPKLPPLSRRHREERLRLAASGLQLLAIALFAGGIVAPLFNGALTDPLWMKASTIFVAALAESAAFIVLRYIPFSEER